MPVPVRFGPGWRIPKWPRYFVQLNKRETPITKWKTPDGTTTICNSTSSATMCIRNSKQVGNRCTVHSCEAERASSFREPDEGSLGIEPRSQTEGDILTIESMVSPVPAGAPLDARCPYSLQKAKQRLGSEKKPSFGATLSVITWMARIQRKLRMRRQFFSQHPLSNSSQTDAQFFNP